MQSDMEAFMGFVRILNAASSLEPQSELHQFLHVIISF